MKMTSRLGRAGAAILVMLSAGWPVVPLLSPAAFLLTTEEAQARAGSSGGYSRPSLRTPSPSRPSTGGYRRPPASAAAAGMAWPGSDSDQALSRRGSAEALQRYRAQSVPPPAPPATTAPAWGERRGWVPPSYAGPSSSMGGVGNALLMWFLLDTLTRPGRAEYFHNHQDDPAYQSWRRDAEQRARDDPELRSKLAGLDTELARRGDQPRDPNAPPPEVPPRRGGSGFALVAVAILAAGFFLMWRARRKMKPTGDGSALDLAARMARQKLGGEPQRDTPYRLGMTLDLDPTPFVLAGSATKVRAPAGGLTSVAALGRLTSGAIVFDRLYLPQDQGFFQLSGASECRFFSSIDHFVPANADEWAFWLDNAEGLIGWPSFETKDGKVYGRLWQPGDRRVEPPRFTEQLTTLDGASVRQLTATLYAAPTGVPAPAPETEYVLVAAVEAAGQAWVEVLAGIDVNAASLSLPSRR
ncbi:MAG: DUF2491 family protein [Bacteroidota bacterium]